MAKTSIKRGNKQARGGKKSERPQRPGRPSRRPTVLGRDTRETKRHEAPPIEAHEPLIIGRHPVLEALRAGRSITRIWVQSGLLEGSLREIVGLARDAHIAINTVPKVLLDRMAETVPHQGVIAQAALKPVLSLDDLEELIRGVSNPLIYVLDGIQDPQNLGAILRVADATGAAAVVIPERGAVGLTAAVGKASAGAIEYVPVVRVTNLSAALQKIKSWGVFVYAADPAAERLYTAVDWRGAVAILIGAEGRGIRPLVKSRADDVIRLPMFGHVNSLNAATAAAVLGFEVVRQRSQS